MSPGQPRPVDALAPGAPQCSARFTSCLFSFRKQKRNVSTNLPLRRRVSMTRPLCLGLPVSVRGWSREAALPWCPGKRPRCFVLRVLGVTETRHCCPRLRFVSGSRERPLLESPCPVTWPPREWGPSGGPGRAVAVPRSPTDTALLASPAPSVPPAQARAPGTVPSDEPLPASGLTPRGCWPGAARAGARPGARSAALSGQGCRVPMWPAGLLSLSLAGGGQLCRAESRAAASQHRLSGRTLQDGSYSA